MATDKPIVVKIGGGEGIDYDAILSDIAELGRQVVIVHGGNAELNKLTRALGKEPTMMHFDSGHVSRYTNDEGIGLFEMAYCGKINSMVVEKLHGLGVNAIGLSGIDGGLIRAKRKERLIARVGGKRKVIRDDRSGKVEEVDSGLLGLLLDAGYTPVISPPALSYENQAVNVDGDLSSALIAGSLGAEQLIILSNVPGLLRDPDDQDSIIESVQVKDLDRALESAKGRMKIKLLAAKDALDRGVTDVVIGDARIERPVSQALRGKGTVLSQ